KLSRTENALLFGSIFNPIGNEAAANFKLISQLSLLLDKDFVYYRLVIRFEGKHSSNTELTITLDNVPYPFVSRKDQNEFLIPTQLKKLTSSYEPPSLKVAEKLSPFITTSYV